MKGDVGQELSTAFGLFQDGQLDRAEPIFTAVLAHAGPLPEVRYGLARLRMARGEAAATAEATTALADVATAITPAHPPLLLHAGEVLMMMSRFGLAACALRKACEIGVGGPDVLVALARCELALGKAAPAAELCRRALADAPDNVDAIFRLAQALERDGHWEDSINAYRAVLARAPQHNEARGRLAHVLLATGAPDEAIALAHDVLRADAEDVVARSVIARGFSRIGDYAAAEQEFIRLTRVVMFMRAQIHIRQAVPHWREDALELEAIVRGFWDEYSGAIARQGWFAQALEQAKTPPSPTWAPYRPGHRQAVRAASSGAPRVSLVSFASQTFRPAQQRLIDSALAVGGFDEAVAWSPEAVRETHFFRAYDALLARPRGEGYWAWKPFIIYNELLRLSDGDCVVYYDSGRDAGNAFTKSARDLVAWCTRDRRGFMPGAVFRPGGASRRWTKRDCFVFMDCDRAAYWDAPQTMAMFSIWRNSPAARDFVREWMNYAIDPRIISDHPNVGGLPNHAEFLDHREDQSILSNLVIRHGLAPPAYETSDINGLAAVLPPPQA